jgi:hypothetical protein
VPPATTLLPAEKKKATARRKTAGGFLLPVGYGRRCLVGNAAAGSMALSMWRMLLGERN